MRHRWILVAGGVNRQLGSQKFRNGEGQGREGASGMASDLATSRKENGLPRIAVRADLGQCRFPVRRTSPATRTLNSAPGKKQVLSNAPFILRAAVGLRAMGRIAV